MRAALVHHLLSGQAWFTAGGAIAFLLAADLAGSLARRPGLLPIARVAFLLAIGVAALSGTPVPLPILIPLAISLAAVIGTGFRPDRSRASGASEAAALVMVLTALAAEAAWHRAPRIRIPPGATIVVLGDSLSSGGFGEAAPWPERLAKATSLPVRNLSLPGETVRSAMKFQLPQVPPTGGRLVVIELGGNDLLGGARASDYAAALDALLASVGGEAVMFELPLPPGRWRWGAAQRRIARKRGVPLLPKAMLSRVLSNPRFAGDGLHLTDQGHQALARGFAASLQIPDRPGPAPTTPAVPLRGSDGGRTGGRPRL